MTIIDVDEEIVPKWFEMEGGGRVQLRTISAADFRAIQKQTVRKKVDFKKVDGTPGRFEYESVDQELQNELYWDAVIVGWENLMDKNEKPIPCNRENKTLLMTRSKKFLEFVVESLKALADDETTQQENERKN
jgi:hypothetical protein